MFTPLLVSSCYSFHYGTMFPRDLVQRARSLGYRSLALTDRNGVFGIPQFLEAGAEGLQVQRGTELGSHDGISPILGTELAEESARAILIARTREGWSRICRILTDRAEGGLGLAAAIRAETEGGPCVLGRGTPPDLFIATDDLSLLEGARGGVYALLTPTGGRAGKGARSRWKALAETGAPPLATGEVRFLHPRGREVQRLLMAIGSGRTKFEVSDWELAPPDSVFTSPSDAARPYESVPEGLRANEAVAESVDLHSLFERYIFPAYISRDGDRASEVLRSLAYRGAAKRYGAVDEVLRSRLEYELGIIEEKGFSDYFLIVRDIARKTSRTCGRGSAAASVVSYALEITDVDPLAQEIGRASCRERV